MIIENSLQIFHKSASAICSFNELYISNGRTSVFHSQKHFYLLRVPVHFHPVLKRHNSDTCFIIPLGGYKLILKEVYLFYSGGCSFGEGLKLTFASQMYKFIIFF